MCSEEYAEEAQEGEGDAVENDVPEGVPELVSYEERQQWTEERFVVVDEPRRSRRSLVRTVRY